MYRFELEAPEELSSILAKNVQKRRLEKGMSRTALSSATGVPAPTIAKFEKDHTISLVSFIALVRELGYSNEIKSLLSEPRYSTIEELDIINKNKNRKRGRNENSR